MQNQNTRGALTTQASDVLHLDPVENNSSRPVSAFKKGMYREQYLHAATNGVWGHRGAGCGKAVIIKGDELQQQLRPVLCDRWTCALCGPRRAAWLKRELKAAQLQYELRFFWTLTIRTSTCTPTESDELVTAAWNKLEQRIKRKYGRFSFIWIREHTKKGYAHLHLLVSLDVDPGWLSASWLASTGGSWIVDVAPVDSSRAGDYLAKYCTQQAGDRELPEYAHLAGRRFFSKSRDVQFAPFRGTPERSRVLNEETGELVPTSPWHRQDVPYWDYLEMQERRGWIRKVERRIGTPFAVLERARPAQETREDILAYLDDVAAAATRGP